MIFVPHIRRITVNLLALCNFSPRFDTNNLKEILIKYFIMLITLISGFPPSHPRSQSHQFACPTCKFHHRLQRVEQILVAILQVRRGDRDMETYHILPTSQSKVWFFLLLVKLPLSSKYHPWKKWQMLEAKVFYQSGCLDFYVNNNY